MGQVTLKENADASELQKAKDHCKNEGGEIKHEFSLIKGFTYVSLTYLTPSHCPTRGARVVGSPSWEREEVRRNLRDEVLI
jgi:hypothetical protein